MFHILTQNSIPARLTAKEGQVSTLLCGLKGGQVREAVTFERANTLANGGKLNEDRVCAKCARKIGVNVRREAKKVNG